MAGDFYFHDDELKRGVCPVTEEERELSVVPAHLDSTTVSAEPTTLPTEKQR